MPFSCPVTGELASTGLDDPIVTVETNHVTLASNTVVRARSTSTTKLERWVWKEEAELTPEQLAQWKAIEAAENLRPKT